MDLDYEKFLEKKRIEHIHTGHDVDSDELNPFLFPFQRASVQWALKKGRAALFFGTGLGKTISQASWADDVVRHTGQDVLILAPLCVAKQTVSECAKFGISVNYCREQSQVKSGINITNYEMVKYFDLSQFVGVVLDESSILKSLNGGKTRRMLIDACKNIPYRLSCTATPSPNDYMELGGQAEFLGIMSLTEMLATFFIHDAKNTGDWRLKGHGADKFWEWMATWAITIRMPSDLGFDDDGYILPPLNIINHVIETPLEHGQLMTQQATDMMDRKKAAKKSVKERCEMAAKLANESNEQIVIWCNLNAESDLLAKLIPDAKEVKGTDSIDKKEQLINDFVNGKLRVMLTKAKICGYGLNLQDSYNTILVGLNDSFESYYQLIRRFYRFGQKHEVNAHLISMDTEGNVKANLERKEKQADAMHEKMIAHMRKAMQKEVIGSMRETNGYNYIQGILPKWL